MSSRTEKMEQFLDELALVVDGDPSALARHADFLADDDEARDLRHEASGILERIRRAGDDYEAPADLEARVLARLGADLGSARPGEPSFGADRKTDPGSAIDPARGVSASSKAMEPARADFGSTVRANAFAPTEAIAVARVEAPTTSGERTAIPATRTFEAAGADLGAEDGAKGPGSPREGGELVVLADRAPKEPTSPSDKASGAKGKGLGRVFFLFGSLGIVAAAALIAIYRPGLPTSGGSASREASASTPAHADATSARVVEIERAAGDEAGTGIAVRAAGGAFASAGIDGVVSVGGTIRTDARTRVRLALSDGSSVALQRDTELSLDPSAPRRLRLVRGEVLADVAHLASGPSLALALPNGTIEVLGTKLDVAVTDDFASVRVTRGKVRVTSPAGSVDVHQGEEGVLRGSGAPRVSPAIDLARAVAWADFGDSSTSRATPSDAADEPSVSGFGSLRARRPGDREDRERPLRVASANVRVRISGNVARTEVEQVFMNDGPDELEGIYRFPLPADARIARLALDVNGRLEEGAFVARSRARRIWTGIMRNARPASAPPPPPREEFIWVPERWRDPALLEWQRGGGFELRIFPIPARGSRRVVLAYTQVVQPSAGERRYVYPLPVSRDGSTRIGELNVDVRVLGADQVRASGYTVTRGGDADATTLDYRAENFVPNGDLVIDYALPGDASEASVWTYQGDAAVAPPERSRDRDRDVVDAQRQIAADTRGYATFALRPRLPARTEGRSNDYVIVVDSSQSMVGERFSRASALVAGMLAELDRRDRFAVLACDYACRSMDGGGAVTQSGVSLHEPTADDVRRVVEWLGGLEPAGATDLGATLGVASRAVKASDRSSDRDVRVIYVGDGLASVGHREASALAARAHTLAARDHVSFTTVGLGGDADNVVLAAIARASGGQHVPFVPGQRASTAALAVLETTYGVSIEDARIELPAGISDVAPAALPTLRSGEELIVSARLDRPNVEGDVILRGTVGGAPFEQRYPLRVTASTAAGNRFVPAEWAAATIGDLELQNRGEDEARIIALSKAYSVMSRHTSLLVLESEAMFRDLGIDRVAQSASWTGEEELDDQVLAGVLEVPSAARELAASDADGIGQGGGVVMGGAGLAAEGMTRGRSASAPSATASGGVPLARAPMAAPRATMDDLRGAPQAQMAAEPPAARRQPALLPDFEPGLASMEEGGGGGGRGHWERWVTVRVGSVSSTSTTSPRDEEAARAAELRLEAEPNNRDRHRAAVRLLARAGRVDRALEVADAWIARDRMDPDALAARADLLARSGHRDEALRVLTGIVDLRPDDVALQERLALAFERAGLAERSCAHRIAMAEIDTSNADRLGRAVGCERALGEGPLANILLGSAREASTRTRAERVAGTPASRLPSSGELMLEASWVGGDDLDLALITTDGTRVSWMGGRPNVVASTPMGDGRETLGLRSARLGTYLIEVSRTRGLEVSRTRGSDAARPISGTVRVRVRDATQTLRFTLTGERVTIGRATVRNERRLVRY